MIKVLHILLLQTVPRAVCQFSDHKKKKKKVEEKKKNEFSKFASDKMKNKTKKIYF